MKELNESVLKEICIGRYTDRECIKYTLVVAEPAIDERLYINYIQLHQFRAHKENESVFEKNIQVGILIRECIKYTPVVAEPAMDDLISTTLIGEPWLDEISTRRGEGGLLLESFVID